MLIHVIVDTFFMQIIIYLIEKLGTYYIAAYI